MTFVCYCEWDFLSFPLGMGYFWETMKYTFLTYRPRSSVATSACRFNAVCSVVFWASPGVPSRHGPARSFVCQLCILNGVWGATQVTEMAHRRWAL